MDAPASVCAMLYQPDTNDVQAAGCWRSEGNYRSLPPNVSSSAFYTIFRFPRSSRAPRCSSINIGGCMKAPKAVNGKMDGLIVVLPS